MLFFAEKQSVVLAIVNGPTFSRNQWLLNFAQKWKQVVVSFLMLKLRGVRLPHIFLCNAFAVVQVLRISRICSLSYLLSTISTVLVALQVDWEELIAHDPFLVTNRGPVWLHRIGIVGAP